VEAGWEVQFGIVDDGGGPRYFWGNFASRVVNGDSIISDCEFHRVGSPVTIEAWPEVDVGVLLTLPAGAQRNKMHINRNRMTECGLSPFNGSAAMIYIINGNGDLELTDNIIDGVKQSLHVGNALTWLSLNHSSLGGIEPDAISLFGAGASNTDIGAELATLKLTDNDVDMGSSAVEEPAWCGIAIRGAMVAIGDPVKDSLWQRATIARNKIRGNCVMPVRIRGQNGLDVFVNEIQGRDDSENLRAIGCVNLRLRENRFSKRPTFNIVLEETVRASFIQDGTTSDAQGLSVLVLGAGNEMEGVKVSTEPADLPVDPGDAHPFAPK
jgi:hypothetical protein